MDKDWLNAAITAFPDADIPGWVYILIALFAIFLIFAMRDGE